MEQGTRFICLELNYRYSVGLNKKNVLNLEGFKDLAKFSKKKNWMKFHYFKNLLLSTRIFERRVLKGFSFYL
jgi:hypothetical protein